MFHIYSWLTSLGHLILKYTPDSVKFAGSIVGEIFCVWAFVRIVTGNI